MVSCLQHYAPLGKSHHVSLIFNFNCYINNYNAPRIQLKYHQGQYNNVRKYFQDINWDILQDKTAEVLENSQQASVNSTG